MRGGERGVEEMRGGEAMWFQFKLHYCIYNTISEGTKRGNERTYVHLYAHTDICMYIHTVCTHMWANVHKYIRT